MSNWGTSAAGKKAGESIRRSLSELSSQWEKKALKITERHPTATQEVLDCDGILDPQREREG